VTRIRSFVLADVPRVAELHASVLIATSRLGLEERRDLLRRVFLDSPWHDEALPSLVAEAGDGRIVGFLGVLPRRMACNGRPVRVGVTSQYVVAPGHRGLTGLLLFKRFLAGPQDLSMTDGASHETVRIWKAVGGTDSIPHSIHWTRPLRPLRYALSCVSARIPPAALAAPLGGVLDAIATRLPRSPLRLTTSLRGEALTVDAMLDHADEFVSGTALRAEHDRASLKWLLEMAERKTSAGELRRVLVRDAEQDVVGLYLYYLARGGASEVLQIAGRPSALTAVVEHLFHDAWRAGATAVSGRLQPELFDTLKATHCLFHGRGSPVLLHARRRELLDAVRAGAACLTRLDGEWWMSFQQG